MKRALLCLSLCIAVLCCCFASAFAFESTEEIIVETTYITQSKSIEELTDISSVISSSKNNISLSAEAAVLYCANNSTVIYSKNAEKKMKIASTTKVMTSILTLEAAAAEDKTVTFTEEMIAEGSSMYLKVGDKIKLSDLAVGMLLQSGNDAANAAAIAISGSIEEFAVLMNKRAEQIGMKNTNFMNPSGLDQDEHYSTAYDMALLLAYAMENDEYAEIDSLQQQKVEFIYPEGQTYTYSNHNKLLKRYEHCNGGKTGFTKTAGRCLVSSAEKDNLKLVAVTLKASDDWNDHIEMFNFGFEHLAAIHCSESVYELECSVVGGVKDFATLISQDTTSLVVTPDKVGKIGRSVFIPSFIYSPVKKDKTVGTVIYKMNGLIIAENSIKTAESVDYKE